MARFRTFNIFRHLKEGIFGGSHPLQVIALTESQYPSFTTIDDVFRRSFIVPAMATDKRRLVLAVFPACGVAFPRLSAVLRNLPSHKGAVRSRSRIPPRPQGRVSSEVRDEQPLCDGAYLLEPLYTLHISGGAGGLYRLSEYCAGPVSARRVMQVMLSAHDADRRGGVFSFPSPEVSMTACSGRDATRGSRFSVRDMEQARQLAPVVNAPVQRNWSDLRSLNGDTPEDIAGQPRQHLSTDLGISPSVRQVEIALLLLQRHSSVSIGLTRGKSP